MQLFPKIRRHADLFTRMAETVDADLPAAAIEGRVQEHDLRTAIFSCLGCDEAEACRQWLDAHSDGAGAPPSYCRNTALLQRLAAG
ncbi:MAG: DUF6455 family protein [Rhodobacter sp.]|nr:DUF6455 family protein [Rhodobacter sp.]